MVGAVFVTCSAAGEEPPPPPPHAERQAVKSKSNKIYASYSFLFALFFFLQPIARFIESIRGLYSVNRL